MQHRAKNPVRGRHRRTATLRSHRVLSTALGAQGRYAMLTAALVAGVGVAGIGGLGGAAAPAGAAGSQLGNGIGDTRAAASVARGSTTSPLATVMPRSPAATPVAPKPAVPALAFSRSLRKPRPVPVPVRVAVRPPAPEWVNPIPEATVTSCFGPRWGRLHAGVDLAAAAGTPIRAVGAGTVVRAGIHAGHGLAALIDHGNGYLTHYGHMSVVHVRAGQRVAVGQPIGDEGSTGHSTGPHLHFEVHEGTYGNPIEPILWLSEHGVDIPGCTAVVAATSPGKPLGD